MAHGGLSADLVESDTADCTSRGRLADARQAASHPTYHSPERISGHGISQADDTWAISVTLYFLLTGTMPFAGNSAHDVHQRFAAAPAPLAVFDVGDDALQAILNRFLARGMGQRVVQTAALRDALSSWKHGASVAHLPPLDEDGGDSFGDFDDDDDDEEHVQTVMRDFSDVREHLKRIEAQKPRPAAGAPASPDMRKATSLGGFRAPSPDLGSPGPGAYAGPPGFPGAAPPQASPYHPNPHRGHPGVAAPHHAPAHLGSGMHPSSGSHPGAGLHPAGLHPAGLHPAGLHPAGLHPADPHPADPHPADPHPAGLHPGSAPQQPGGHHHAPPPAPFPQAAPPPEQSARGFDIDDDDSDSEPRTMLMDADQPDLSAAIAEALAAKQRAKPLSGPPPGWPPGPPQAGLGEATPLPAPPVHNEDDDSMAPTAAFDASMLPAGMMPDPLGGPGPLDSTVDRVLNNIPPPPDPPLPDPPQQDPQQGMMPPPAASTPGQGSPMAFPDGGLAVGPAPQASLGMLPGSGPNGLAPMAGLSGAGAMGPTAPGMHGMAGMMSTDLPNVTDEPKSALRTALIVAIVVLVMVVLAVVVLYLERQGVIDLGLQLGDTPAAPAPTSTP